MLQRLFVGLHVAIYRGTHGKIGGRMRGAPVLLLTTRGKQSGKRRVAPLLYQPDPADPDALVLIASMAGAPRHPAWYHNLVVNPEVTVQTGGQRRRMRAETAEGDERQRLWDAMTAVYPAYDAYQEKTARRIPVVRLRPA